MKPCLLVVLALTAMPTAKLVAVTHAGQRSLSVTGDYHQTADGELTLALTDDESSSLRVTGEAELDGVLTVVTGTRFKLLAGTPIVVLTTSRITGTFGNPHGEVVGSDGRRFTIGFSKSAVTLTAN